jgi:hypothetical protein
MKCFFFSISSGWQLNDPNDLNEHNDPKVPNGQNDLNDLNGHREKTSDYN